MWEKIESNDMTGVTSIAEANIMRGKNEAKQMRERAQAQQPSGNAGEHSRLEQLLREAIEQNNVDTKGYLAAFFNDEHKPGSENFSKYNENRKFDNKRAFRLEWAKQKLKGLENAKSHSRSFERIETEKGTYYGFGRIVVEEGGWNDPAAIKAATRYVSKCLVMGGAWTDENPMTERTEFLYVKRHFIDEFRDKWSLCEKWMSSSPTSSAGPGLSATDEAGAVKDTEAKPEAGEKDETDANKGIVKDTEAKPEAEDKDKPVANKAAAATDAAQAATTAAATDTTKTPKAKNKAKADKADKDKADKADGKTDGTPGKIKKRGGGEAGGSPDPKVNKLQPVTQKAAKTKEAYLVTTASTNAMIVQIELNKPDWVWANNDANLGKLKAQLAKLQNSLGDHGREILVSSFKDLGKTLGTEALLVRLDEFNKNVLPLINDLQGMNQRITNMQKAASGAK